MAGRPTKYTPALGQQICKLVSIGVSVEAAAASQGVTKRTVYNWRERGAAGKQPYADFLVELEKAMGTIEKNITIHLVKRAKDDWKAGAWWLERRRPEVYGDQGKHDRKLEVEFERFCDAAKRTLDPTSYQKLLRDLARSGRSE